MQSPYRLYLFPEIENLFIDRFPINFLLIPQFPTFADENEESTHFSICIRKIYFYVYHFVLLVFTFLLCTCVYVKNFHVWGLVYNVKVIDFRMRAKVLLLFYQRFLQRNLPLPRFTLRSLWLFKFESIRARKKSVFPFSLIQAVKYMYAAFGSRISIRERTDSVDDLQRG